MSEPPPGPVEGITYQHVAVVGHLSQWSLHQCGRCFAVTTDPQSHTAWHTTEENRPA